MASATVKPKIRQTIEGLLRKEIGRFGVTRITVEPGEDHDGDPVIFVDVDYGSEGDDIDPRIPASLVSKVRDRSWRLGEERFPHIRHHASDERRLVGDP
jgi:hypothetical protein